MQNFILRDPTPMDLELLGDIKFTNQQIEERAKYLSEQIKLDLKNIDCLVCIMDGGYYWANLLEKNIRPTERINTNISFYDNNKIQKVSDSLLSKTDFNNKTVLVAEDIIATGRTIREVIKIISNSHPKSLSICAMIDKPDIRFEDNKDVNSYISYVGFVSNKNEFLCGFGMKGISPLPENLRNVKNIYLTKETPVLYEEFTKG